MRSVVRLALFVLAGGTWSVFIKLQHWAVWRKKSHFHDKFSNGEFSKFLMSDSAASRYEALVMELFSMCLRTGALNVTQYKTKRLKQTCDMEILWETIARISVRRPVEFA